MNDTAGADAEETGGGGGETSPIALAVALLSTHEEQKKGRATRHEGAARIAR